MERHKNLFRQIPPWSLVVEILDMLGLSKYPPYTFQRDEICIDQSIDAVSLLEPYYVPCKAAQFLSHTDKKRWITILRHILECHRWSLIGKETTRNKKKAIIYSIQKVNNTMEEDVKITFD
jgi:hypothetical protein